MGSVNTVSPEQDFSDWDIFRLEDYLKSLEENNHGRDRLTKKKVIMALGEKTILCDTKDKYINRIIEIKQNVEMKLISMGYKKSKTPNKKLIII